jgi:hypothetical protein
MKKILLILVVLLVLGGIAAYVGYKYFYNKPHPDYVAKEADVKIDAKRLWVDYTMNKDIADPKYTGKVLEIEGGIMRVEESGNLVIVVFAYKRGDFGDEGIRVTMLPEYASAAKGINPFKEVKIKGLCTGYNGTDIIMESGSIVGAQK